MRSAMREDGHAVKFRRRILIVAGILTAIAIAVDIYLTLRLMKAPVMDPGPAPDERAAEARRSAPPPTARSITAAVSDRVAASAPSTIAGSESDSASDARIRHLSEQAEDLRKESRERAEGGSGLSPPKEEAERMISEGLEIF